MKTKTANIDVRRIPEVKISCRTMTDMRELTKEELNTEIKKGYTDMQEGRTRLAELVFADLHRDYGLQ